MEGTASRDRCLWALSSSCMRDVGSLAHELDGRSQVLAGACQVTFQRPVEVGDLLQLRCHIMHTDTRHDLGKVCHML